MTRQSFFRFWDNESGAVTVDWVVLTAAIVGIAITVIALISGGVESASSGTSDRVISASLFGGGGTVYGSESDYSPWGHLYPDSYNSGMSTADVSDLETLYLAAYDEALNSPDPMTIDTLAGYEAAMVERGVDVPDGNSSASELQEDSGFGLPT
ncbi:hypothetical protein A9Q96_12125 [Rhodobacterales bacterium 52_120_T64]|nr:hypothetical protein A9Q96_12125 [Rhodobacterales bacterium 52_120_T64]